MRYFYEILILLLILYNRTLDRSIPEPLLSEPEESETMSNTFAPITHLAEAADAAAWQFVRLTPGGSPRRLRCGSALVERQMR
jgi:hypothetical protein